MNGKNGTSMTKASEYTVYAQVSYPGLVSKVMGRETSKGLRVYHVIHDELSEHLVRFESADFHVEQGAKGKFAVYESGSLDDYEIYMERHRRAVEMWNMLYLHEGRSLDDSLRLASSNREKYEQGKQ